ncbi:MAG: TraR/DksA family transcriptional regulator [Terrimicrobiaceae bacterium]
MPTKPKQTPKAKPAPKAAATKASVKTVKKAAVQAAKPKPVVKPKPVAKPKPVSADKGANHTQVPVKKIPAQSAGFLAKQRERLLILKDTLLDSMSGVAKDSLRSRAEGSEASAFGMHQADAGSDAYDRDFALSLLSQEQDSLYEIDEALKRVETGAYGQCEISGKAIPHARLEALPFTRYTVECQAEIEKKNRYSRVRQPVASLFGLGEDGDGDGDDDDSSTDTKD